MRCVLVFLSGVNSKSIFGGCFETVGPTEQRFLCSFVLGFGNQVYN